MMSLILHLEDKKLKTLFETNYPSLRAVFHNENNIDRMKVDYSLPYLKSVIEDFIRKKCEDVQTVKYLWSLRGLIEKEPLNIFTLNYDGTIEMFCEKNDITYTDGFEPYWDPRNFEKDAEINLFKLHGSLYWLKSRSGKPMKIPLKGLEISSLRYLTDESVSEMMIYPVIQKNKQSGVYSWLSQKFKDELQMTDVCVVLGYSFRDDDITESIIEALSSNHTLWLVIVNPQAGYLKKKIFELYDEINSRIVVMNMTTEEALGDRYLYPFLSKLDSASRLEQQAWIAQSKFQIRLDYQYWKNILHNYLEIGHDDHVKWLVETLWNTKFSSIEGNFPDTLEGMMFTKSLQYMVEYHKEDEKKYNLWKKVFIESCSVLEYSAFERGGNILRQHNPLKHGDLPSWYRDNSGWVPDYMIEKLHDELKVTLKNIVNKRISSDIEKLIQTLRVLSRKKEIREDNVITLYSEAEIVENYVKNDLGLKKWATEIVNSLK